MKIFHLVIALVGLCLTQKMASESLWRPKIHSVWLTHKACVYFDSVWGCWLRPNVKLRIGQNSNCQLRNYMFVLLIAEISWYMWKWAETKTACLRFAPIIICKCGVWKDILFKGNNPFYISWFKGLATIYLILDCYNFTLINGVIQKWVFNC